MISKSQIVATIGPSCSTEEVLSQMIEHQMDVARLNFSWGTKESFADYIEKIREIGNKKGKKIIIIGDLSGPRVQETDGHTYDKATQIVLTERDREYIKFGVEQKIDYFALSFVGTKADVLSCRLAVKESGGNQKIIAKIERNLALEHLDEIIEVADAVMIARGDLGNELPLERIPFVQAEIIMKCKKAGKSVITATQMMLSMVENPLPTRAEVTDVANAILQGSDAVMLSDETAVGKYPVETVSMMERILIESEKHSAIKNFNHL